MFNLLMFNVDWTSGRVSVPIGRVFEYTESHISEKFRENGNLILDQLVRLPCLFCEEGTSDEVAYVGQIVRPRISGRELSLEIVLDPEVPTLLNRTMFENRADLDMHADFEFSRNHWAVKDVDLYRFLLRNIRPRRQRPTVFQISEHENIEPSLVSVMMPFDAAFGVVADVISQAASSLGLRSRRADDIWENAAIIQDVAALIDRSRIVVCDCSGRNPNVFYEAGIAHTLGREVIIITQSEHDIPFDLRHLRYIKYLNNAEGLQNLKSALEARMQTILGH
jgi:hypothetical protein